MFWKKKKPKPKEEPEEDDCGQDEVVAYLMDKETGEYCRHAMTVIHANHAFTTDEHIAAWTKGNFAEDEIRRCFFTNWSGDTNPKAYVLKVLLVNGVVVVVDETPIECDKDVFSLTYGEGDFINRCD